MAYADKDRQREFQREWARKKAATRPTAINSGFITWGQLQELEEIEDVASFEECIKEAKKFIAFRKINRLAIAKLALRACTIKWGGKRRKFTWQDKTLKAFSEEIKIHHKTLFMWIETLGLIQKLPKEEQKLGADFTAAQQVLRSGKMSADPVTLYYRYKKNPDSKKAYEMIRAARYLNYSLKNHGTTLFDKEEKRLFIDIMEEMANVYIAAINGSKN